MTRPDAIQFRKRLAMGEVLAGTFAKTPTGHATEIFGDLGYDFIVIDEEHAPFDRRSIDEAIVAARAANIAALVRVASSAPSNLLSVLDCGAVGVLVPHVATVESARDIAAACRYRKGSRGFSNSPRAGRYGGLNLAQHLEHADAITTVVAQIEDPSALSVVEDIARVDGIDALFVGRGDLAAAMEESSPEAPAVRSAAERVAKAARAAGKPVLFFVGSLADAAAMREIGASGFIYMSDQGLMRQAAAKALADLKTLK
ncbi:MULTISPECIES: aldolase/citrate lyase family protein [unclassified Beijerinckia]|uniref:HpcH/HpaI aldolase family protein n=1 Tax=unclassified Beijerinckia TaxID=2638183 RepID=UPI00089421A6|nr:MULTISPECIES: aldolase/citrate lyase family protein [unclassified Beijerinckia]MDH7795991.1 2-keto-3-deoxy-L-rhamnonate aldolase RhmA [Beijerinckia sp. GAS462]SEC25360.1 2-keto-3-deoxy-L-rhamnonate aldolase RhmA [Beijerinckia sp. 28-YEA-48]